MDNNSYNQFLIMKATIDTNRLYSDEKMNKLTAMVKKIMDKIKFSDYSPDKMDSPKAQYPTTVVLANKKAPQLEGGHY